MKNLAILLAIIFYVATTGAVDAQLSKKERKEWKKKLKKTSPEQFKRMYDENASLKQEVSSLQGQLSTLQNNLGEKEAQVAELSEKNQTLEARIAEIQSAMESKQAEESENKVDDSGVVFKVQIGAFRNKDLSKYFNNSPNFSGETDDEGLQHITLGHFRDYWKADTFKKYLREMGVNDAWIVPYKDGQRVEMKDVLEGVI